MKIDGRTVLVTGASSGIGAATARALAGKGARVVMLARTRKAIEDLATEIEADGGRAHAYAVDCADSDAVADAARRITDEVGTPDILVNNAGAGRLLYAEQTEPAEFVEMMSAPYLAAVFVTRAFLPAMVERGSGHIVNVNSPAALIAWPGAAGYTASRWALRGFNEALRADLARGSGIKVTHVIPGKVSSSYFEHNPGADAGIPRITRLIRTLTPEDVADLLIKATERDRRQAIAPLLLRLLVIPPRLGEMLLLVTARPRPRPPGG